MKRSHQILIVLALLHFIIGAVFIAKLPLAPLYNDSLLYLQISKQILTSGKIPEAFMLYGHVTFPVFKPFLIAYPIPYILFFALAFFFFGVKTGIWLELIASTASIILLYMIMKELFNERIAIIAALLVAIAAGAIVSTWDQDMFIVATELGTIFFYIKLLKEMKPKYLLGFSLLAAASIGMKQSAYVLMLAIFVHFFLYFLFKTKQKRVAKFFYMMLAFALISLFAFPFISYEVSTTGTISPAKLSPWPVIDQYFFKPKYLEIPRWQYKLNRETNLLFLKQVAGKTFVTRYGTPEDLIENPVEYFSEQFNIFYAYKFAPLSLRAIFLTATLLLLYLLGVIIFIFKIDKLRLLIVVLFIANLLSLLFLNPKSEYFLAGMFLYVCFPAIALDFIRTKQKVVFALLVFFVFAAGLIASVTTFIGVSRFLHIYTAQSHVFEAGEWLQKHTTEDDLIMAEFPGFPYYVDRNCFWDFRLLFLNRERLLYYLKKYYRPKYVVIDERFIQGTRRNWVNAWVIPHDSEFLKLLKSNYFAEVMRFANVHIYKFKLLYPLEEDEHSFARIYG